MVAAGLALPATPASAAFDCPGSFLVYQPLPAGPVKLPGGSYEIKVFNLSCDYASRSLTSFLGSEELPPPWTAAVATRTFFNGKGSFSVSTGRAGGGMPGDARTCPPFTITRGDRIGSVAVPKGRYAVSSSGPDPLTCLSAARLLVRALDEPPGSLPAWTVTSAQGPRPGAILRSGAGQTVSVRRLDGRTAGGGHTPCPNC